MQASTVTVSAWRVIRLPLLIQCGCFLMLNLVTIHWWVGLTPSPITGMLRQWSIPSNWNPTGIVPAGQTLASPNPLALLLVGLLLVASAAASFWAVARAMQSGVALSLRFMLIVAGLLGMLLVFLPVLPSDDLFSYSLYGRIAVLYHANPLVTTPDQFPADPLLRAVFWQHTRSVYGPAWLIVANRITGIAQILGGHVATYVLLFKGFGLGCHLINAVCIWNILAIVAPQRQVTGTLLYAWNPLALLEFAGSGHNDVLMLTLILVAIWLFLKHYDIAALVIFGCAIATKYIPLIFLPLLLLVMIQVRHPAAMGFERLKMAAWRGAIVVGVVIVLLLPFWAGPQTILSLVASPPAQQLGNSLMDTLSWPLRWVVQEITHSSTSTSGTITITLLRLLGTTAFLGVWVWQFLRTTPTTIATRSLWIILAYLMLGTGWFWPWYATWPLIIVALRPFDRLTIAIMLFAGGALTLYGFLPLLSSPLFGARSLLIFLPAIVWLYVTRHPQSSTTLPIVSTGLTVEHQ